VGAKRSSERFRNLWLSFFSDCGSTGRPSAAVVAIAAVPPLHDSRRVPSSPDRVCSNLPRHILFNHNFVEYNVITKFIFKINLCMYIFFESNICTYDLHAVKLNIFKSHF
jgi:hypothetical protein